MHVLYHVHCATCNTLPLAMSTKSVDRDAEGKGVCLSDIAVVREGLFGLVAAVILGAI